MVPTCEDPAQDGTAATPGAPAPSDGKLLSSSTGAGGPCTHQMSLSAEEGERIGGHEMYVAYTFHLLGRGGMMTARRPFAGWTRYDVRTATGILCAVSCMM